MCKYCKHLQEVRKNEIDVYKRSVERLKKYIYRCDLVLETAIDTLQDVSATLDSGVVDEEVYDCICRIDNMIDQFLSLVKSDFV